MMVHIRALTGNPTRYTHFSSIFNPKLNKTPHFSHTPTLKMPAQSASKRPICPSCSKPTRTCLCNRIQTPGLDNSVHVTILQHSLEQKHPLNSARIAKLGLKNVNVVTVSDVNFDAQFDIRLMKSVNLIENNDFELPVCENVSESLEFDKVVGNKNEPSLTSGCVSNLEFEQILDNPDRSSETNVECSSVRNVSSSVLKAENVLNLKECVGADGVGVRWITANIGRYGSNCSVTNNWMPRAEWHKSDFEQVLASRELADGLSKGFVVKKLQNRLFHVSVVAEEDEEFELEVPCGSVLLFPSDKAMGVKGLDAIGFNVKNLIVLDGTWAKAMRMYNENPWLKLLPHLKLDVGKISLYSEVRQQPRAECLSTIESIVFALKAVGENPQGLDNLLDVFESMVGDQRRCKEERLSKDSLA